jgi:NADH dehydrogenase
MADIRSDDDAGRPRVLVVGGGFAGFYALKRLERKLPADTAELMLVSATDYLLYTPLLPEVAAGTLDPRDIAVPLRQALRRTRTVLGHVTAIDLDRRTATVLQPGNDHQRGASNDGVETAPTIVNWDRLVLTPGSVSRQFEIPGVAEHAHGFKTLTEAIYLRDHVHVLEQLDIGDSCPDTSAGDAERQRRLTVVAVGAGYTGTEFVAQMQRWVKMVAGRWDRTGPKDVLWVLVDVAEAVLPELGPRLGRSAMTLLRKRGVDVRLGVTITSADQTAVTLTNGDVIPTSTVVWGAGVAASPLIATLGLPLSRGRLVVDPELRVSGTQNVWSAGDAAAVPHLTKPGRPPAGGSEAAAAATPSTGHPVCPPTAQHAQRQGKILARNVAASLGVGNSRPYRHRDLGVVADLGGYAAVAKPLGVPLTGLLAKAVTRAHHLQALTGVPNRIRVAVAWALAYALPAQAVQLSAIPQADALMTRAQATDIYPEPLLELSRPVSPPAL